jgi:hypothetical protein
MDARWCDLRLIGCGYIGVFFHDWGVSPVLCRARGAGRVSGCLADVRPIRAVVTSRIFTLAPQVSPPKALAATGPALTWAETRLPAGDTPPQAETLSPLLSLASLALSSGQDPSSVLVAMTTKTDEGSRLGYWCSQGRSACWRHGAAHEAQGALQSLWHHPPCRSLTTWLPRSCRRSRMPRSFLDL